MNGESMNDELNDELETLEVLDIMGNRIELGDTVVFGQAQSMRMLTGKVVKISSKTVRIEHKEYANGSFSAITESQRAFKDVLVVGRVQ